MKKYSIKHSTSVENAEDLEKTKTINHQVPLHHYALSKIFKI